MMVSSFHRTILKLAPGSSPHRQSLGSRIVPKGTQIDNSVRGATILASTLCHGPSRSRLARQDHADGPSSDEPRTPLVSLRVSTAVYCHISLCDGPLQRKSSVGPHGTSFPSDSHDSWISDFSFHVPFAAFPGVNIAALIEPLEIRFWLHRI
jgi:hypothetical protein